MHKVLKIYIANNVTETKVIYRLNQLWLELIATLMKLNIIFPNEKKALRCNTFRLLGLLVHGLGLGADILASAVDPDVHDLASLPLLQLQVVLQHALVSFGSGFFWEGHDDWLFDWMKKNIKDNIVDNYDCRWVW